MKIKAIFETALFGKLRCREVGSFNDIYKAVSRLNTFFVSCKYGITETQKREIAESVIRPLMDVLMKGMCQPRDVAERNAVTHFFFTGEAHMNCLYNFIMPRFGKDDWMTRKPFEDYLSHFVFQMEEDLNVPTHDPRRFIIKISHSTGVNVQDLPDPSGDAGLHTFIAPSRTVCHNLTLDDFIEKCKQPS